MARIMGLWRRRVLIVALFGLVAGVSGCAATFTDHGYVPTKKELAKIVVGVDSRNSVAQEIGQPAGTGVLTDSAWYYVASRVRHFTYNANKIVKRELVAISFNKKGIVSNIERFTLADGRVIALNRRVTSSGVKGESFIRQILGSLGRPNLADQLNPGSN